MGWTVTITGRVITEIPGPGLRYICWSRRIADHLPLYRQSERPPFKAQVVGFIERPPPCKRTCARRCDLQMKLSPPPE